MVQVVTDNASNCRRMGRLLEAEFPTIVWTPCASHCLDLLMEDVAKLGWVKRIVQQATSIVNFFLLKLKVLAMFREHSRLDLKKPSATRFASMWQVLEHLYDVRPALRQTVVSTMWNEWDEHITEEAKAMQRFCLEERFWTRVRAHFFRAALADWFVHPPPCPLSTSLVHNSWRRMQKPIHGFVALVHSAYKSPIVCTNRELRQD